MCSTSCWYTFLLCNIDCGLLTLICVFSCLQGLSICHLFSVCHAGERSVARRLLHCAASLLSDAQTARMLSAATTAAEIAGVMSRQASQSSELQRLANVVVQPVATPQVTLNFRPAMHCSDTVRLAWRRTASHKDGRSKSTKSLLNFFPLVTKMSPKRKAE